MAIETRNLKEEVAEALYIKNERSTLNVQEQPMPLKSFN